MSMLNDRRMTAVRALMAQVAKEACETDRQTLNSARLEKMKIALVDLARQTELFNETDFPSPTRSQFAKTYLLAESPDRGPALYLISILPPCLFVMYLPPAISTVFGSIQKIRSGLRLTRKWALASLFGTMMTHRV